MEQAEEWGLKIENILHKACSWGVLPQDTSVVCGAGCELLTLIHPFLVSVFVCLFVFLAE